jgi:hypothetical protein
MLHGETESRQRPSLQVSSIHAALNDFKISLCGAALGQKDLNLVDHDFHDRMALIDMPSEKQDLPEVAIQDVFGDRILISEQPIYRQNDRSLGKVLNLQFLNVLLQKLNFSGEVLKRGLGLVYHSNFFARRPILRETRV